MKRAWMGLMVLLLPVWAGAQTPAGGERLLALPPAGFILGHSAEAPDGTLEEFVPDGETVQAWSQMMTIRAFPRLAGVEPAGFHEFLVTSLLEACPAAVHQEITATVENGAPVHLILAGCPNSPVTGGEEWFMSKSIGGQAGLYNVQGAWRGPATEAIVAAWAEHLRGVVLCDPARAEMPCPAP